MIRRSPAEYYIRYLLVHPDKYGDDDISRILREHQLDNPACGYFDRLRAQLCPPVPFHPMDRRHLPSYRFLVSEKLHKMFFPDKHTVAALRILKEPRAKEMVESMGIVQEPVALTAVRLSRLGRGQYDRADVLRYQHFFWNVQLVDNMELRALLTKRIEDIQLAGESKENLIAYQAMKKAQYNDPRHSAASSVSDVAAAMRLTMRYGYMPGRADVGRIAALGVMAATAAAAEAGIAKGPKSAQEMRDYAIAGRELQTLVGMLGSPDEGVLKDLQQLAMAYDKDKVPSIKELSGGNYSDGLMLTEGEEASDE